MSGNRQIPVLIVNTTNKTYSFKKGSPLATVIKIEQQPVSAVDKNIQECSLYNAKSKAIEGLDKVDVPNEYNEIITRFLKNKADLFAATDADLSHTDTVKMRIDTRDNPPIKLKPYHTQINNRKVIDKAVDEMLDAKIIERSRSPW